MPKYGFRCGPKFVSCRRISGITTVYVTHDQEEALTLSDRIAVIEPRKTTADWLPARSLRQAPKPLCRRFHRHQQPDLRGSQRNCRQPEEWMRVQTDVGMLPVRPAKDFQTGEHCMISVRPETAVDLLPKKKRRRITIHWPGPLTSHPISAIRFGTTWKSRMATFSRSIFKTPGIHQPFPMGKRCGSVFRRKSRWEFPLAQERC